MGLGVVDSNSISSPDISAMSGPSAVSPGASLSGANIPGLNPQTLSDLNAAQASKVSPEDRVVTFDLDETLIACNKLTSSMKESGKSLGYDLKTSNGGKEYFLRPGAEELFKWIKEQGFKIVVSSRNLHAYEEDIINSSPLKKYVDHTTGLEDLKKSWEVASKDKFPNHPNNKLGFFTKAYRFTTTAIKGLFVDVIYRGFKHYIMRNKNIKPYFPIARWKLNKYPPYLSGSRILFDNLYAENKKNALASKDWIAGDPGEFWGDQPEAKNENGEYVWTAKIKEQLRVMKDKGWQELYKREYGQEPENTTVDMAPEAKSNTRLKD